MHKEANSKTAIGTVPDASCCRLGREGSPRTLPSVGALGEVLQQTLRQSNMPGLVTSGCFGNQAAFGPQEEDLHLSAGAFLERSSLSRMQVAMPYLLLPSEADTFGRKT